MSIGVEERAAAKRAIRRNILSIRDGLSEEERRRGEILLTERILGHQWFYRAEFFLCFASFGSEISTWEILREALRTGKKVYLPKVLSGACGQGRRRGGEARMDFFRISSLEDLTEGYRGIPEPAANVTEIYQDAPDMECLPSMVEEEHSRAERTLMLMPGVAFDLFRNRLGYGRGFYDRYLAGRPQLQLRTIAVGYRCQMVEALPASDTDIRPYQVICV